MAPGEDFVGLYLSPLRDTYFDNAGLSAISWPIPKAVAPVTQLETF
jgi:hypothetical protein